MNMSTIGAATALNDRTGSEIDMHVAGSGLVSESLARTAFAPFFASTRGLGDIASIDQAAGPGLTPLIGDTPVRGSLRWIGMDRPDAVEPVEPVDSANNERITLLARKYVAKETFPTEQSARLAIVTERVRGLLPAVTAGQFEKLETFIDGVRRIGDLDKAIRQRLGILPPKRG